MRTVLFCLLLLASSHGVAQPFPGLDEALARGDFGQVKAVAISRYGERVFEQYYRGTTASDLHQVQSVTKSIGSALIGIAHRQGIIELDQGLEDFFGNLYAMDQGSFADKGAITVEAVLQQRHGLLWDESATDYRDPLNPVNRMINAEDWYRYILTTPTAADPFEHFAYSTGASTLMSRMIRVASGLGPGDFAMRELFSPLGISTFHWEAWSEEGLGHGLTDWPNPDSDEPLGFGLWLRPVDMLKLGELFLQGGVYNGQRILDESWIEASWTKYSHEGNSDFFPAGSGGGHGYQWWIQPFTDSRNRTWHAYFAAGWGGQGIVVVPELGLVVATVANNYDWNGPTVDSMVASLVMPAVNPRLDHRFDGSWYESNKRGQGVTLQAIIDDTVLSSYWYTYDLSGNQRWFIMVGPIRDGVGEVTIYETEGGVFLQESMANEFEWGTGRYIPIDCEHLRFEINAPEIVTTIELERLSGVCYEPPGGNDGQASEENP